MFSIDTHRQQMIYNVHFMRCNMFLKFELAFGTMQFSVHYGNDYSAGRPHNDYRYPADQCS